MKNVYLILFVVIFFSCNKNTLDKKFYPDGRLNYTIENKGDYNQILDYEGNKSPIMELKFKKDHFIDTIYYFDTDNPHFFVIDSLKGPYFYGTYYLMYNKQDLKEKGTYRYKRNLDFRKTISSIQPFGTHFIYDKNGNIKEKIKSIIVNDTVYTKTEL